MEAVFERAHARWGDALQVQDLDWGTGWGGERLAVNSSGPSLTFFSSDPDRVQFAFDVPGEPVIEYDASPGASTLAAVLGEVEELVSAALSGPFRLRGSRVGHMETDMWPEVFASGRGFAPVQSWATSGRRLVDALVRHSLAVEWPKRPDDLAERASAMDQGQRDVIDRVLNSQGHGDTWACGEGVAVEPYSAGSLWWLSPAYVPTRHAVGQHGGVRREPRVWLGGIRRDDTTVDLFGCEGVVELAWGRSGRDEAAPTDG